MMKHYLHILKTLLQEDITLFKEYVESLDYVKSLRHAQKFRVKFSLKQSLRDFVDDLPNIILAELLQIIVLALFIAPIYIDMYYFGHISIVIYIHTYIT